MRFRGIQVLIVGVLLASAVVAIPSRAAAQSSATWQLIDYQQRACVSLGSASSDLTTYYGIWIKGTWSRQIDVGIDALPSGAKWWTSSAPIPPGSSDGVGSLAYVAVKLARGTKVGSYTAQLWADDGRSRQSVPVTIVAATSCRHGY
jgi:hypothetical protein